jgi:hypothetical protein
MNQNQKEAAIYVAKVIGLAICTGMITMLSVIYIGLMETSLIIAAILLVNLAFAAFENKVKELEHLERMNQIEAEKAERMARLNQK